MAPGGWVAAAAVGAEIAAVMVAAMAVAMAATLAAAAYLSPAAPRTRRSTPSAPGRTLSAHGERR